MPMLAPQVRCVPLPLLPRELVEIRLVRHTLEALERLRRRAPDRWKGPPDRVRSPWTPVFSGHGVGRARRRWCSPASCQKRPKVSEMRICEVRLVVRHGRMKVSGFAGLVTRVPASDVDLEKFCSP